MREKFLICYELNGAQRAIDLMCNFYGVPRMRVILNGRRVGAKKSNGWQACYFKGKAYFTKQGLNRKNVLHEFFHHLVDCRKLDIHEVTEERQAEKYSRQLLKR